MNKPDWAERLQRTFAKKEDNGYTRGWYEGGLVGIETGKIDERERLIALFEHLSKKELSKADFTTTFLHFAKNPPIRSSGE